MTASPAAPWRATVLTLFPEMFPGPLGVSLAGRALMGGIWSLEARDIRASATDKHRSVDDTPAGGGPGMVLRADVLAALQPEAVVPAMLVLAAESAPTRTILCAGAGTYEAAHITLTEGVHLGLTEDTPERLAARLAEVTDRQGEQVPQSGAAQGTNEVGKAFAAKR